jgi:hypothetical protein
MSWGPKHILEQYIRDKIRKTNPTLEGFTCQDLDKLVATFAKRDIRKCSCDKVECKCVGYDDGCSKPLYQYKIPEVEPSEMSTGDYLSNYHKKLLVHVRDTDGFESSQDAIFSMFDESVEKIIQFDEDDYQGSVYALYKFLDKWFVISKNYGSYDDELSLTECKALIAHVVPVDDIWKIEYSEYDNHDWKCMVIDLMEKNGCLDKFHAFRALQVEEQAARDEEIVRLKVLKDADDVERERIAMIEKRKEYETSLLDVLQFFENDGSSDPFFEGKKRAKLRMLKWYCNFDYETSDDQYKDAKKKGIAILDEIENAKAADDKARQDEFAQALGSYTKIFDEIKNNSSEAPEEGPPLTRETIKALVTSATKPLHDMIIQGNQIINQGYQIINQGYRSLGERIADLEAENVFRKLEHAPKPSPTQARLDVPSSGSD